MKIDRNILKYLRYALEMKEIELDCSSFPDGSWDGPEQEGKKLKKEIVELKKILKENEN